MNLKRSDVNSDKDLFRIFFNDTIILLMNLIDDKRFKKSFILFPLCKKIKLKAFFKKIIKHNIY